MGRFVLLAAGAIAAVVVLTGSGSALGRGPELANRCFALSSLGPGEDTQHGLYFLKPTGLGTYMLRDGSGEQLAVAGGGEAVSAVSSPGPTAEWRIRRRGTAHSIVSTQSGTALAAGDGGELVAADPGRGVPRGRFNFRLAHGCNPFPEAQSGAAGRPFRGTNPDGTVFGFIDDHLHITADMRAGGEVISGQAYNRFGITEALGRDADVHGPSGGLDITGNLLRSGSPAGFHDTEGWPSFSGWPTHDTVTHQQVYYAWLQRAWMSGLRLVVAQTVADESLCRIEPLQSEPCDEMASIRNQVARLRGLQAYVDAQSGGKGEGWFRIVTNPTQARRVIEDGKLAVVIGAEASNALGCGEFLGAPQCDAADIDAGLAELHRLGVRSLFVAHWTDNAFAGAAFEGGARGTFISALQVAQTGHPFAAVPCEGADESEGQCNSKGLTDLGRHLVAEMMKRGMLIEVDHLSQKAREGVMRLAEAADYPVISSHTGTGGEWTPEQLRRLYALGGLAAATPETAGELAQKILAFRRQRSAGHFFGVGLGTDTGGFSEQPGPRPDASADPLRYPFQAFRCDISFRRQRSGSRSFDLNSDGVAHYGLIADLVADMAAQPSGQEALRLLFSSAEAYLQMWERASGSS